MRKRIISIFLIVSIIISVFAVGVVSTSAASKAAKPTITCIRVYPNKINVNWTKDSNTSYYAVWVLNKSTNKWSAYPTTNNYINFNSLQPKIAYAFQVRGVDKQGRVGAFSKSQGVSFIFPQKPAIYSCRNGYGNILSLHYGVMNYSTGRIQTWLPYAKSYDILIYNKGKKEYYFSDSYDFTLPIVKNRQYAFQVRALCVYDNIRYLSPWSDVGYSFADL